MKENFPNLVKEIDVQVHETQKVPDKKKLKEVIITKPLLYEMLEGLI